MNYEDRDKLRGTPLTPRELEVLKKLASGYNQPQIAIQHNVSVSTVTAQVWHACARLGALNSTHAVAIAARRGLLW